MKELFNKKLFGHTLRLYRNTQRHTLDAVSIQTGISIATLHRYETGQANPLINNIMILCHDYLKISVDVFTTQHIVSAADILNYKVLHTFTSLASHLTLDELLIISRVLRRYENNVTLFDAIKDNTFSEIGENTNVSFSLKN